jgi:Ca-activated chloride channel family protein
MTHAKRSVFSFAVGLSLAACLTAPSVSATDPAPASASDLVFVLDASNSMWGHVEGENKIVIARRVFAEVLGNVPDGAHVGLVAYGHRREADCKDIELVVAPAPIERAALKKRIDSIKPRGKTPIAAALNMVFSELEKSGRPATIVLMTDGLETCKGDPCQTVRDAKAKGTKFILHVIGFDVGDMDVEQLQCAAREGAGLYFAAANAGQFSAALGQAVGTTPQSPPVTEP